jgi:hypothetical protein
LENITQNALESFIIYILLDRIRRWVEHVTGMGNLTDTRSSGVDVK